jgi:broad specificity phosphatase PhoE
MKHLYFVRHGESQLGKQGLWAGSTDSPLSDEGRQQAIQAGQDAIKLHIDYIISSDMSRAYDTAAAIADAVDYPRQKIEVNKLVRERNYGSLEATPWNPNYDVDSVPDAESRESILGRAREFAAYLRTIEADTILVVSHGGFGRALRHVLHDAIPFDKNHRFENAKIVKLL